jgi:hypothetical protein
LEISADFEAGKQAVNIRHENMEYHLQQ